MTVLIDCRFDSARNGYNGTAVFIDTKTNKVLHMENITRKETGSSWKIEDEAVQRGLQKLQDYGIKLAEAIHDDKKSVDKQVPCGPPSPAMTCKPALPCCPAHPADHLDE